MTTLSSHPGPPAPASDGRRHRALLAVLAGNMLIDALEVSVLLVALPAIGDDLGRSPWQTQWVMSGFALGFAAMLVLGPRLTARWGRRKVYLAALIVLLGASVAGGLADNGGLLVLVRVVKGMCAALTAPTGLAIISATFREGADQRRAVSTYSLFGAAGFTIGLLSSGALTGLSWRWDLVLPAPVALLLLVAGWRLVPDDRGRLREGAGARVPLAALLGNGRLVRGAVCAATLNGTYLGLLLLVTYQLHREHGWDSWATAVGFLPACVPLAVSLPFAGRMIGRFGTDRLIVTGAVTSGLGCTAYALRGAPDSYVLGILPTLLLMEAGFVLSFAALNMSAVSGVPDAQRARAVRLYQTAVQLGAVLVLPAVAVLIGPTEGGGGYRAAALLLMAVGGIGALAALTGARSRPSPRPGR
ncbi:MFS transporter [Kitasatospora sp. NPDC091207]|uniref:MFS transporter n=1 Tax=Kitasatospora sp. NPDC091207 TaxID=3364083 RepID=UPI0037FDFBF9